MAYPSAYHVAPPCATQEVFETSQLDSACTRNFRCCGSYDLLPCLPNHHYSQIPINPNNNSAFIGSQPPENFGWDNALNFSAIEAEAQNAGIGCSGVDQDLIQVVSKLERRIDGLAGVIENLRDEIEEKTRFFVEVEAYIQRLVEWTKNSKQATDSLIAELKEAVDAAN